MDINSEEYKQEVLIKDVVMLAAHTIRIWCRRYACRRYHDTYCKKLGYSESNSFVTNTVIQFTLHSESFPRIFRITSRDTNLIKISQANKISRQITNNEISLAEAKTQLEKYMLLSVTAVFPLKVLLQQ